MRYDRYEWKKAGGGGNLYLTAAAKAKPEIYDPLRDAETLVLEALNIGRRCMSRKTTDAELQAYILQFAEHYGLMGLMTALPTTPNFMEYEAVYLPKNHYIKEETMGTEEYLALFFTPLRSRMW